MGPDERAIRDLNATWIDAVNAADLHRLMTFMADDAVFLGSGQAPVGREGFPAVFSAGHEQGRLCCVSELGEVVVVGDVAYSRARDTLTLTPHAGGDAMRLAGHRLTVWRKRADGHWVLARDAHTLAPVAG